MYRSPSFATTTYSMSAPTAQARLDGSVHGVVVQASSHSPVSSLNRTVTDGSCRSA